jgi:exodeoxyribonuclease VII large subunit
LSESFFDFRARMARPKPVAPSSPSHDARTMTVAELTARIESAIKSGLPGALLVQGEISNLNIHRASGHIYFTLKDDKTCIDCVMFRSDAERLKIVPRDGDQVLATGTVRVYPQRGRYQFYVTRLTPTGRGALEAKFQLLKEKLESEGLFAPDRKKTLPRYPQRIALITSRQAAALQDILKVLNRFAWVSVQVCHVPVQGAGSAGKIAAMIQRVGASKRADLILLSRGGGSLEDLWEFNEEAVARAIAASGVPVITGIGHEVDVSIADLVADYHAHTPTEAAQVAMQHWRTATTLIDTAQSRLQRLATQTVAMSRQRLTAVERHEFFRRPTDRIERAKHLLDDRERQLSSALRTVADRARRRLIATESRLHAQHPRARVAVFRQKLLSIGALFDQSQRSTFRAAHQRVEAMTRQLEALSPTGVLSRGYSITSIKKDGRIVRSVREIRAGDVLVTRLSDGTIQSVARDPNQLELF